MVGLVISNLKHRLLLNSSLIFSSKYFMEETAIQCCDPAKWEKSHGLSVLLYGLSYTTCIRHCLSVLLSITFFRITSSINERLFQNLLFLRCSSQTVYKDDHVSYLLVVMVLYQSVCSYVILNCGWQSFLSGLLRVSVKLIFSCLVYHRLWQLTMAKCVMYTS